MISPFVAVLRLAEQSQYEPKEFFLLVNAHIEALQSWETRRLIVARESALRGTPMPMRSDCDSDAAFLSAMKYWNEAQTFSHHSYPAPSAPIVVERAIQVHTASDGSRTFTYLEDEWGNTVFRDALIQQHKAER